MSTKVRRKNKKGGCDCMGGSYQQVGPSSGDFPYINAALNKLINEHNNYISKLNYWKRYLIWRYTLGSASINKYLLNIVSEQILDQRVYWSYIFFNLYDLKYSKDIPASYKKFFPYFNNPKLILKDSNRYEIAEELIKKYIVDFTKVINKAPKNKDEIIVYKAATPYPEIKQKISKEKYDIVQKPFNSTTYNPNFNFNLFLGPQNDCCLFELTLPKGTTMLAVSNNVHAYPFEYEIILKPQSVFQVYDTTTIQLNYYDQETPTYQQVQELPFKLGNVYDYIPTGAKILSKQMKLIKAKVIAK